MIRTGGPYLGQHWKRRGRVPDIEYIINGGDNWHLGPYECEYELIPVAPYDPNIRYILNYGDLMNDYEPID